jgi:hypothetical protein
MTLPGLVAAKNLADVADRERAWDNLGLNVGVDFYPGLVLDDDARSYLNRVALAGDVVLESSVAIAINEFVVGCKADGIWSAIKTCCILAGARTLNGALVPLVGTAPTNFNFVEEDYNRKTGLVGDGSTKCLNSNRNNNADPQNSHHLSFYCSLLPSAGNFPAALASTPFGSTGATQIYRRRLSGNRWEGQSRNSFAQTTTNLSGTTASFVGVSRASSSLVTIRANGVSGSNSIVSQPPGSQTCFVFAVQGTTDFFNGRLAFYSIGESLDLALLDARVTTLINAFAAAIP